MSDIENIDVMLASYSGNVHEEQENAGEIEIDLESRWHQQSTNLVDDDFSSLLNTNVKLQLRLVEQLIRKFPLRCLESLRKLNQTWIRTYWA